MLSISPVYARYVLQEFQRRNIDTALLFAGTGLDETSLLTSDAIGLEDFNQLLQNGRKPLDDELGLVIGRQVNVMTLGSVGVAAARGKPNHIAANAVDSANVGSRVEQNRNGFLAAG